MCLCVYYRAGKTEVLTDDLQAADKHVEQIRAALVGLNKRLGTKPNESSTQEPTYKEKRVVRIFTFLKLIVVYIFQSSFLEVYISIKNYRTYRFKFELLSLQFLLIKIGQQILLFF